MTIGNESYMNMFADDAKIQRRITTENSCLELQSDLTKLYEWSCSSCMESPFEKKKNRENREGTKSSNEVGAKFKGSQL